MTEITQRIEAARRRLLMRQWAGRLAWSWCITLAVAAVAVLAPKLFVLPPVPAWWGVAWLAGGGLVGLVVASVWTAVAPRSREEAAVELDRRFELRERVASALSLTEQDARSPAGAALLRDAERAVRTLDVESRFPLSLDARAWLPAAPVLVAAVALLFANRAAESSATPAVAQQAAPEEAQKAAAKAKRALQKKRERAEREGLADATELLKKIEAGAAELAAKRPENTTQAAVKLNDLSRALAERRDRLGGGKQLRDRLNRMEDLGRGPADKMAEAMKQGDWAKAAKEVERLRQQIAAGKASPEAQKQLAAQLDKLKQRLEKGGAEAAAQKKELERQLAEAQRKGDANQADKVRQKLDQLAQQQQAAAETQQMAQQLQQAQQALQQGNPQQAAAAMDKMAQQMQQLQQQAGEMEMLDAAMTDIQDAKLAMGMQPGQPLQKPGGKGGPPGPPGSGLGEGRGEGDRPEEKNDVAFRDSSVKQEVGRGASTFGGLVKGPSVKGEVAEAIKAPLTSDAATPADPLAGERLPRSRREHAEEYFRQLRDRL